MGPFSAHLGPIRAIPTLLRPLWAPRLPKRVQICPNGPYCAAVAIGSKLTAQVLTKALKGSLKPPSYKTLGNIAERALSAPDWKSYQVFQSQLLEESVRFGDKLDIQKLEQRLPTRFESARRDDLVERLGESLQEVSSYRPESPLRKSIDAVKQKIKQQHQDFTR